MSLEQFIQRMPKVELHVHLEGSIQPKTLLKLAKKNGVPLPAHTIEELQDWYQFTDFPHFIEIYMTICDCLRTPEDFELIAWEFLQNQYAQNIVYSEVTFTPFTHHEHVTFEQQLAAINRAITRTEKDLGVSMRMVPDISRQTRPVEHSLLVAKWAVENQDNGIAALGLGGAEIGSPPELFTEAFAQAETAGLPSVPHTGETAGPASIWGALQSLSAVRIGHGVRCLEDPALVAYLHEHQIPLEVCPTSNVCLGVFPSFQDHPLPELINQGLYVTINSDDPPMFGTTLTKEFLKSAKVFDLDLSQIKQLVMNSVHASLLPPSRKSQLEYSFLAQFRGLENELGL